MAQSRFHRSDVPRASWCEEPELPQTLAEWVIVGLSSAAALFGLALILHRYL
jgi:hypothetical protein